MNREKHIREMSGLIYENRPIKDIWNEDADSIAETLYNAGYRKQSEGEWVEHETAWGDVFWSCSVCGDERCAVDGSIWELGLNFCSNCGAKMKGGAE